MSGQLLLLNSVISEPLEDDGMQAAIRANFDEIAEISPMQQQ